MNRHLEDFLRKKNASSLLKSSMKAYGLHDVHPSTTNVLQKQKDFYQVWSHLPLEPLLHAKFKPIKLKELEKLGPKLKGIGMDVFWFDWPVLFNSIPPEVSQSVKEVLQSLVDDGLVQGDKIGSSNCELSIYALKQFMLMSSPLRRQFSGASHPSAEPLLVLVHIVLMISRVSLVARSIEHRQRNARQLWDADSRIENQYRSGKGCQARKCTTRAISLNSHLIPSQDERTLSLETLAASKKELAMLERELSDYGACDPAKVEDMKRAVTLAKEASVRWTGKSLADCCLKLISSSTLGTKIIMRCYSPTSQDRRAWIQKKFANTLR